MTIPPSMRVAVLVPCFNEEAAVATVVADFRKALPSAEIYVVYPQRLNLSAKVTAFVEFLEQFLGDGRTWAESP